ncbi:MAG: hypothetical protein HYU66_18865 [Armatimonadetes bacterium]|nr:hypothetical protein [Armatimonadota bacterium]
MDNSGAPAEHDDALLDWTVHPARDRPRHVPWVVFYLAVVVAVLHAVFASVFLTLLGAGLLVGAAGEFLFLARYRLTPRGAERLGPAGRRSLAWDQVRAAYLAPLALVDRYATARRRPAGEEADDGARP